MDKNELRPIKWYQKNRTQLSFGPKTENTEKRESPYKTGFFHLWKKIVDDAGSETIFAIVEDENGKLDEVEPFRFEFTDRVVSTLAEIHEFN